MNRIATAPITLSDGTKIAKGTVVAVPTLHMQDGERWPEPMKFDGHRFLRMREQPGNENRWQFVTTSAEHLGFGHGKKPNSPPSLSSRLLTCSLGKHACPGRFFASNEIKIAVAHLLLKYDWQFEGGRPESVDDGTSQNLPDAKAKVQFRARTPEIDIDAL